jgi:hypothetical protein
VITASQSSNPPAAKWNTLLPSEGFVLNLDVAKLGLDETSSSAKTESRTKKGDWDNGDLSRAQRKTAGG